jgi:hypothetical protein
LSHLDLSAGAWRSISISRCARVFFTQSGRVSNGRYWRKAAVGIFANKLDAGRDSGERVVNHSLAGWHARTITSTA